MNGRCITHCCPKVVAWYRNPSIADSVHRINTCKQPQQLQEMKNIVSMKCKFHPEIFCFSWHFIRINFCSHNNVSHIFVIYTRKRFSKLDMQSSLILISIHETPLVKFWFTQNCITFFSNLWNLNSYFYQFTQQYLTFLFNLVSTRLCNNTSTG